MSAFFVTGAGTDVGKTFVAAGLIRKLRAQGRKVRALKPVASGFEMANAHTSDPGQLLTALGYKITEEAVAAISPWRFKAPLSPDMAAAKEDRAIDFDALVAFSRTAAADEIMFVEGVGGVMVPLDGKHTTLDWMQALGFPVILVGGSYLGAISHTLGALEVLRSRALTVAAVVVSETGNSMVSLDNTVQTVAAFAAPNVTVKLSRSFPLQDAAFNALAGLIA
jgi:dethiobiotin synthetase